MLRKERGDTLVEVLVAIMVVSMVLVAAYVTTTRNLNSMQDTEEHSQALQLAQTQLEFLHNTSSLSSVVDHDCFKAADGTITNGPNCQVDSGGAPTTTQPQFTLDITKDHPPAYQVTVTWVGVSKSTQPNNVTLYYLP